MMQNSVKSDKDYECIDNENDIAALLKCIRTIGAQVQTDMNVYGTYLDAQQSFHNYYQSDGVPLDTYPKHFKYYIECAEHFGGGLFESC